MKFVDENMAGDEELINCNNNYNNNNEKGLSIANRRAGFDASSLHPCELQTTNFFTVSPGISPSALLGSPIDSPVMLPNTQAQRSPTTGRCSFSPDRDEIIFRCENKPNSEDIIAKSEEECKNNCKLNNGNPWNEEQKQGQQQKCWEDGFVWRKYGQKQVKGSEYPRSYYKCTSTNCDVTKKVERSLDGQISEIVYKGSHNHPPVRKNEMKDIITNAAEAVSDQDDDVSHHPDLPMDAPPPVFDHQISDEDEGEEDDHTNDPKRRKIREGLTAGPSHETTATARSGREPKIVLQVKTEIDILEDGYRWRKYGQKVVKGNPNPRSYYKCTSPDCFVRKHVERAADDIKSVVITYEGKHNHGVPTSRNNSSNAAAISVDNISPLTNPTLSTPSTMPMPMPMPMPRKSVVNRVQDQRPVYLQETKPILNYNEFMTSNLTTSFGPLIYPFSFHSNFHSLPTYNSGPFLMNNNIPMNNYPMVNSDCMSMSLPNHVLTSSSNVPLDPNFHYNSYVPLMQPPLNQGQEIKEEHNDFENKVVYDDHICLSLPDYGK